jgi:hypothetical protein
MPASRAYSDCAAAFTARGRCGSSTQLVRLADEGIASGAEIFGAPREDDCHRTRIVEFLQGFGIAYR